jgi:hypothetical protein
MLWVKRRSELRLVKLNGAFDDVAGLVHEYQGRLLHLANEPGCELNGFVLAHPLRARLFGAFAYYFPILQLPIRGHPDD